MTVVAALAEPYGAEVPTDLYSGLVGALLGAALGGVGSYLAQRTQTTRLIEAGTDQYRVAAREERQRAAEAAEHERLAARRQFGRSAAFELLEALAEVDSAIPALRYANGARSPRPGLTAAWMEEAGHRADHALGLLRRGLLVQTQVIGDRDLTQRWERLLGLAREYATMREEQQGTDGRGNAVPTHDHRVGRAQLDVSQYLLYVHATVRTWLDDEPPPVDRPAPVLQRRDVDAWRWDAEA